MDLKNIYDSILQKMNSIDYDKIWPNFYQHKIALYNEDEVIFEGKIFSKTNQFVANTSIEFNNERIGIWNLREEIDGDVLTSKLVHETFHAFQVENNESRYANELEALMKYKYDPINLSLKMKENRLLVDLIESFHKDVFDEFIALRNRRLQLFPYETNYELMIEQIEGTANFVEMESLKQLNYNTYLSKLKYMCKELLNVDRFFPIRIISYDIGALINKVLLDNQMQINFDFSKKTYLDAYLNLEFPVDIDVSTSSQVTNSIDNYFKETKELITNSVKKENLVMKGKFKLLAVNIYNARTLNNFILTDYFLMYKDGETEKVLYGDYVVKVNDNLCISEVYGLIR